MPDVADTLLAWRQERQALMRGLPAAAYMDEEIFRREGDTVFKKTWVFVAFRHEFTKTGDVQPVEVGGRPIFIVRQRDGGIAAFHNACRHRCLQLVDAPGNVGSLIRCPYHAWAYGLDGALRSAPYFGGTDHQPPKGFSAAEHGLVPVRCAVWEDWIFVNLSGDAEPFESYAAPLIRRLEGIDFRDLVPVATLDFGEVAANWKFLMENFIEPYHVQFVHPKTTDQPLTDHQTFIEGNCLGSLVDLPADFGGMDALAVSSRYLTLFPIFILGRYVPDQLGVYLNQPLGPGRTRQKRVIYRTDGVLPPADEVEAVKRLWWAVHKEDHAICERMQLGRASPVAETGGLLSPFWEDSVRAFQELVVDRLTGQV